MCFNKELSLFIFILGLVTSIKIIKNNPNSNKSLLSGIIIILISCIQLVEFFLWKYNNNANTDNSKIMANKFIIYILFLQVIIPYIFALITNIISFNKNSNNYTYIYSIIISIIVFVYFLIFIYYFSLINDNPSKYISKKDIGSCKLIWGPLETFYKENSILLVFMILLYALFFLFLGILMKSNIELFILIIVSFIFSFIYSYIFSNNFISIFGTLWCFLVIFIIIIYGILF